jgi:protein-S-isoprenylcysteine O-methyltransferase Ste14
MSFLSIFPLTGLLIIAILILLKVLVLRKQGVKVSAKATHKQPTVFLVYPMFLLLFLLWLAALAELTFRWQLPLLPRFMTQKLVFSSFLSSSGAVIILFSVLLMLVAMVHFKSSLRFGMSRNNQGKLVTEGIFSRTRNPFFLSIDLFFIGQAMVFPVLLFISMALLAIISIHLFILREEKFLLDHFQDEYLRYTRKTRRYI